jgi:hypothetical protein
MAHPHPLACRRALGRAVNDCWGSWRRRDIWAARAQPRAHCRLTTRLFGMRRHHRSRENCRARRLASYGNDQ